MKNKVKMHKLTQQEIRTRLVQMLDDFLAYCKKHNLTCFLVGGTLLGAIRHQGFIPWDDDIDVGIPRDDYEKLRKLVRTEPIGEHYTFASGDDGNYSSPYGQMIDTDTVLRRASTEYLLESAVTGHLYIDIFPVDGYPDSEKETARFIRRVTFLRKAVKYSRSKFGRGTSGFRLMLKFFPILITRLLGNRFLVRRMVREVSKYPYVSANYIGISANALYGVGERYRKDRAFPLVEVPFEGKQYPAVACYDEYLKGIYGDYMKLPPKEKRKSHHIQVYLRN